MAGARPAALVRTAQPAQPAQPVLARRLELQRATDVAGAQGRSRALSPAVDAADAAVVLAGDFNMLPPGDDPTRLSAEGDLYTDAVNPMERLLPRFREVFGAAHQRDVAARTYLPFGASQPDRKIDYVFVGGPVEVLGARVLPELDLSDHLPVLARVRVTG